MAVPAAAALRSEDSVRSSQSGHGLGLETIESSTSTLGKNKAGVQTLEVQIPQQAGHARSASAGTPAMGHGRHGQGQGGRQSLPTRHPSESLHPYLRTFTSPIGEL